MPARTRRRTLRCWAASPTSVRSEEHTSELQSQSNIVCRLLLGKKKYSTKAYSTMRRAGRAIADRMAMSINRDEGQRSAEYVVLLLDSICPILPSARCLRYSFLL